MRDYKLYLPHHRENAECDDLRVHPLWELLAFVGLVLIVAMMILGFYLATYHTAIIEQEKADASRAERERIYAAVYRVDAAHEAYIRQLNQQIAAAYPKGSK